MDNFIEQIFTRSSDDLPHFRIIPIPINTFPQVFAQWTHFFTYRVNGRALMEMNEGYSTLILVPLEQRGGRIVHNLNCYAWIRHSRLRCLEMLRDDSIFLFRFYPVVWHVVLLYFQFFLKLSTFSLVYNHIAIYIRHSTSLSWNASRRLDLCFRFYPYVRHVALYDFQFFFKMLASSLAYNHIDNI